MTTLTETKHTGEFIGQLAMGPGYHIDELTLISGQNLAAGTVLGRITASGKYTTYANGASDGSEVAAAILYDATDASGGDVTNARMVRRGPAIVNGNDLGWGANDSTGITAGKADLLALGIKVA
jgi:Bacteriophage lambda head decoration protein D